jgi:hypothetical protein
MASPIRTRTLKVLRSMKPSVIETGKRILAILDWMVGVAERLLSLGIAFVVFYVGWCAFSGRKAQTSAAEHILESLSNNWKALLILLIPLYYRTIRIFLERVKKAFGMELGEEEKRTPESERGE